MAAPKVEFVLLHEHCTPVKGTDGSAGYDVFSAADQNIHIYPGQSARIPLGFKLWIKDPNYAAILIPRSGLGSQRLILANSVGLIDSDYQGEVAAVMYNGGETHQTIHPALQRKAIAQMVFVPIAQVTLTAVEEFRAPTKRGESGFGSTG